MDTLDRGLTAPRRAWTECASLALSAASLTGARRTGTARERWSGREVGSERIIPREPRCDSEHDKAAAPKHKSCELDRGLQGRFPLRALLTVRREGDDDGLPTRSLRPGRRPDGNIADPSLKHYELP